MSILVALSGIFSQPQSVYFEIAKFLSAMAATLFAILGIWIAVLNPKGLLKSDLNSIGPPEHRLSMKLLSPLLSATATFAISVCFAVIVGLSMPENNEYGAIPMRVFSTGMSIFLFLLILDGLFGTLIPIAKLRREMSLLQLRKENRD